MIIKTFTVNPFMMNCYIYWDEKNREGVIIDPGAYEDSEKDEIENYISENRINIKYILLTHGHIDHVMGNRWAKDLLKVPVLMHEEDLPLIENAAEQGKLFGVSFPQPPVPDKFISEGDVVEFSSCVLNILHTPGHSPGSICFVDHKQKIIFCGDTVFQGSIGRTDLWEGNLETLLNSINTKIISCGADYRLYPGHMEDTTVGFEKVNNPFLNLSP
jgi:hydroxyacylglutathione hydrolase